jgi:hypothetical protein
MFSRLFKGLLLTGACAAFLAPSAHADNFTGYGELNIAAGYGSDSYHETELCGGSVCSTWNNHDNWDQWNFGGSVHGNYNFGTGLGLQFDVEDQGIGQNGYTHTVSGGGVHLYERDANYLWGGFVSLGDLGGSRAVTTGVEGKAFIDNVTLYSQVSWTGGAQGYFLRNHEDSWQLHTEATYFLNDNLSFSAGLGGAINEYSYYNNDYSGHATLVHWNLGAEYLLQDLPLSVFATYQGSYQVQKYFDNYGGGNSYFGGDNNRGNAIMIGVRFYFGQNSLIANDHDGAGLKDYNPWYGVYPDFAQSFD